VNPQTEFGARAPREIDASQNAALSLAETAEFHCIRLKMDTMRETTILRLHSRPAICTQNHGPEFARRISQFNDR
jgi:hypothetical protein